MGTTTIPIELYRILEDKLGREQAEEVINLYGQTVDAVHTSIKISVKDELKDELATKSDIKAEIARLEGEIKNIRTELKYLIILMIIAITLMNPVAAEIIKGLLKL